MELQETVVRFLTGLGNVLVWSAVCIGIIFGTLEVLDRRYGVVKQIFGPEDATDAAIFLGAFVIGVFYMVTQFVTH